MSPTLQAAGPRFSPWLPRRVPPAARELHFLPPRLPALRARLADGRLPCATRPLPAAGLVGAVLPLSVAGAAVAEEGAVEIVEVAEVVADAPSALEALDLSALEAEVAAEVAKAEAAVQSVEAAVAAADVGDAVASAVAAAEEAVGKAVVAEKAGAAASADVTAVALVSTGPGWRARRPARCRAPRRQRAAVLQAARRPGTHPAALPPALRPAAPAGPQRGGGRPAGRGVGGAGGGRGRHRGRGGRPQPGGRHHPGRRRQRERGGGGAAGGGAAGGDRGAASGAVPGHGWVRVDEWWRMRWGAGPGAVVVVVHRAGWSWLGGEERALL